MDDQKPGTNLAAELKRLAHTHAYEVMMTIGGMHPNRREKWIDTAALIRLLQVTYAKHVYRPLTDGRYGE